MKQWKSNEQGLHLTMHPNRHSLINDHDMYKVKGQVEVDQLWTDYYVGSVVDKQCSQTTMPKGNDPGRQQQ